VSQPTRDEVEQAVQALKATVVPTAPPHERLDPFYVVSIRKFWILLSVTLGGYIAYWSYRHWYERKRETGRNMIPILRGIFSIFFFHSLFREIDEKQKVQGNSFSSWTPGADAAFVVIFVVASSVLSRFEKLGLGSTVVDICSVAALGVAGIWLARAQRIANHVCDDPHGRSNDKLSGFNIGWIVFGCIIWFALALEWLGLVPS
jgi:hypothetical protein